MVSVLVDLHDIKVFSSETQFYNFFFCFRTLTTRNFNSMENFTFNKDYKQGLSFNISNVYLTTIPCVL